MGPVEGLVDPIEGAEKGFGQGEPFELAIEPAIRLALLCLEPLEMLVRAPMIGGEIDTVSIAPQFGLEEAGSGSEQPRSVAAGAISGDESLLMLYRDLEPPQPKVRQANALAPFNV